MSFTEGGWIRIETGIGRHRQDRKKMAVLESGGRDAVTYLRTMESFGPPERPFVSLIECRLETGRTHQIRVHAAHIGHALIGDPLYGKPRKLRTNESSEGLRTALAEFDRQALHAETLGFVHPTTGERLVFSAEMPEDMHELLINLRRNV